MAMKKIKTKQKPEKLTGNESVVERLERIEKHLNIHKR